MPASLTKRALCRGRGKTVQTIVVQSGLHVRSIVAATHTHALKQNHRPNGRRELQHQERWTQRPRATINYNYSANCCGIQEMPAMGTGRRTHGGSKSQKTPEGPEGTRGDRERHQGDQRAHGRCQGPEGNHGGIGAGGKAGRTQQPWRSSMALVFAVVRSCFPAPCDLPSYCSAFGSPIQAGTFCLCWIALCYTRSIACSE